MEEEDEPSEPPHLVCPRLLACGNIRYDAGDQDAGYSLERVLVHFRPADGKGFGFDLDRMFLFAQLYGTPGEYTLWVRMTRILQTEENVNGIEIGEAVEFAKRRIALPGDNFVECFGFPLVRLPFPGPGVYEFQLWAEGFEEYLLAERVEARE
jgi:hypothetical protein